MSFPKSVHDKSVLDTCSLSSEQLLSIFSEADQLRDLKLKTGTFLSTPNASSGVNMARNKKVISCLFFEPSTRTRMSFEMAAYRLGYSVQLMDSAASSSLSKGESYADTVLNVLAMQPDALVIRYRESKELDQLLPHVNVPVLNAGSGVLAHPTQGLLDAYTIRGHFGSVSQQRVLIVGDVRHSRVARSNFDVLSKLGAEIAVCGPSDYLPQPEELPQGIKIFIDLDEAIAWCTVYMALRIQTERHGVTDLSAQNPSNHSDYNRKFGLNSQRLATMKKDILIMHPGPVNHGVELTVEAIQDSRSVILKQVENGVLIRAALLRRAVEAQG